MKIIALSFFLAIPLIGLPDLPLLTDHPPLAFRLGDMRDKIFKASNENVEIYHSTIRDNEGRKIKCFLDFTGARKEKAGKEFSVLFALSKANEILKENLPKENLTDFEMVDFTRVIKQGNVSDIYVFQFIVKDFTPSGGLGYYPTIIVAIDSSGQHLGRFEID